MAQQNKKRTDVDKFSDYSIGEGFNYFITKFTYETLKNYFYGKTCIEFGCADGCGTEFLLKHFDKVVAVDGSSNMIDKTKERISSERLDLINSYFEDLELKDQFDTLVLAHVLDTVDDPVLVLKKAKTLAHPKSRILIEVPNADSLHRQAGVLMGMLPSVHSFNELDVKVGHQRIYNVDILIRDIKKSGLKILKSGGFMLKPFSNRQMLEVTKGDIRIIKAYSKLGERHPQISAEIYAVCALDD